MLFPFLVPVCPHLSFRNPHQALLGLPSIPGTDLDALCHVPAFLISPAYRSIPSAASRFLLYPRCPSCSAQSPQWPLAPTGGQSRLAQSAGPPAALFSSSFEAAGEGGEKRL